jgi:hypothetical protein
MGNLDRILGYIISDEDGPIVFPDDIVMSEASFFVEFFGDGSA